MVLDAKDPHQLEPTAILRLCKQFIILWLLAFSAVSFFLLASGVLGLADEGLRVWR